MTTEITANVSQLDVKIGGSPMSAELRAALVEIEVENNLHLPDAFTLRLHLNPVDGGVSQIPDQVIQDYLAQQTAIVISQRVGSTEKVILDGEVTSLSLEFSAVVHTGPLYAVVQGYDRSHRLHRGRKTSTFVQMSYSDVASSVAGDVGLQPDVDSTAQVHDYIIQSNQTNWEFLWQLAARIGFELYVSGQQLCFKRPLERRGNPVTLNWGLELMQFRTRASTLFQVPDVTVRGWDVMQKKAIVGQATIGQGSPETQDSRSGTDQANSAFGASNFVVVDKPVATQAEADAMAQSVSDAMAGEFVEAEGATSQGMGDVLPGIRLAIQGLGKHSGDYYVTASTHNYSSEEGYTTSFVVSGRRSQTLAEYLEGAQPSGLSRVQGVVVGIVTNNNDPDGLSRVKVQLPWLDESVESAWARLASPGAGAERGMHWLPEVEDEVLVAFEHGDAHRPYIIGGLWNGQDAPAGDNSTVVGSDGKVNLRTLKSREALVLVISDESGKRFIGMANPDDNSKIMIRHDDKVVEILSNGDITITGAQGKITVEGQDLEVKSSTNIKLEASANIEITAGANLTMKGNAQTSVEAGAQMSVKGVQTSVEGTAMAEVKGPIVRIN